MVDKTVTSGRNVVDLRSYQEARRVIGRAQPMTARTCRHCGAALLDGESDDDCSSVGLGAMPMLRKYYAD